ncbi:MAG: hypothetical protein OXU31_04565, partial [Gammaproteobacteria bacterium]|nr:hypothetical protein [Gammaproteobacteria bacterium]
MDIPSTWRRSIIGTATLQVTSFQIVNDSITESDETITFTLTDSGITHSGTGRSTWTAGSPNSVSVTILANDGNAFSITSDAATIAEDGGNVTFTVTLVGETPTSPITVDWAASGAGITSADYTLSGADTDGSLSFAAPGAQTLVFAITDDSDSESDETLTLTLSNPSGGATLTTASASTVIEDNDAVRTLTVTGPAGGSITEGAAGTFNIGITGTAFSSPTAVTWTITHAQTGGTSDADFTATTSSVMFPTVSTFTVTPTADNLDEADTEAFTIQLSVADDMADGGTAFGAAASVSVTDNDTVTLTLTGPTALGE